MVTARAMLPFLTVPNLTGNGSRNMKLKRDMKMKRNALVNGSCVVFALVLLGGTGTGMATSITIADAGFETPAQSAGSAAGNFSGFWSSSDGGVWYPNSATY